MAGIASKRQVKYVLPHTINYCEWTALEPVRAAQIICIDDLQDALNKMLKNVQGLVTKRRNKPSPNKTQQTILFYR